MLRFLKRRSAGGVLLGGLPLIALLSGAAVATAAGVVIVITTQCPPGSSACQNPTPGLTQSGDPSPAAAHSGGPSSSLPTTTPTTTTGTDSQPDADDATTAAFVKEVQQLRTDAGCTTLHPNEALKAAAREYAIQMRSGNGPVLHVDAQGATAQDRAARNGYQGHVIEMAASGTTNVDQALKAFEQVMHDSDLLNCRYRSSGAAVVEGYWVLVLGDR
jgi:uncharacterized protein YkwD